MQAKGFSIFLCSYLLVALILLSPIKANAWVLGEVGYQNQAHLSIHVTRSRAIADELWYVVNCGYQRPEMYVFVTPYAHQADLVVMFTNSRAASSRTVCFN